MSGWDDPCEDELRRVKLAAVSSVVFLVLVCLGLVALLFSAQDRGARYKAEVELLECRMEAVYPEQLEQCEDEYQATLNKIATSW